MKLTIILLTAALASCVTVPGIRHVELSPRDLWRTCDGWDVREFSTNGCVIRSGKVCAIYTLTQAEWERRGQACKYKAVLRHEERHCAEGDWHGDVATSSPCEAGD